ncbi:protein yadU [Salmonella enterica subsp. enterica]|uniref:Protein yadU n=1 Tax=Salmonella enterica I TaxID=59201 RepID=A0A379X0B5_SALET|nr:protein yadU [Salmonella enterica subsp. enterica]
MAANLTTVALIAVLSHRVLRSNVLGCDQSSVTTSAVDHPITDVELHDINVAVNTSNIGSGSSRRPVASSILLMSFRVSGAVQANLR